MTNFDIEYIKLLKEILNKGIVVKNRTGIDTIKIPKYDFTFDLSKEYPILTTKQTFYKNAILEMLWIWQVASNDVRWLQERSVHIWDEWMVDEDGIYRIYEPETKEEDYDSERQVPVYDIYSVPLTDPDGLTHKMQYKQDEEGNVMQAKSKIKGKNIKSAKWYGKEFAYTIGTAYGYIVDRYALMKINTLETIKKNPSSRRINNSLWQNEFLRTAVLPSCVWDNQLDITNNDLRMYVTQRSCDVPCGLPFNITQYATLLKMIASVTDKMPRQLYYSIKDAHIYVNQLPGILEQIRRAERYEYLKTKTFLELLEYQKKVLLSMQSILDKKSTEYAKLDTENRIIDMILNPTKPELYLNENIKSFYDFDNSKELKDVKIKNYKHMGKIKFPIAQ